MGDDGSRVGGQVGTHLGSASAAVFPGRRRHRWLALGLLAVWGPGLVVMLADTD